MHEAVSLKKFAGLCLEKAIPKAIEKADVIVFLLVAGAGAIVFFVPSLEKELSHWQLLLPVVALAGVTVFRLCMSPYWIYRERDLEAKNTETALRLTITEQSETLENIKRKPPKTAADQHDYDTAKAALELTKEKGKLALRYLRRQGTLTFGTYNPPLPDGLTPQDAQWRI